MSDSYNRNHGENDDIDNTTLFGIGLAGIGAWALIKGAINWYDETPNIRHSNFITPTDMEQQRVNQSAHDDFIKGCNSLNLLKYEEAENYFHSCLRKNPFHSDACNQLAWSFAQRSTRLDEALELISRAISYAPSEVSLGVYYNTLAEIHFRGSNWPLSVQSGENSLSILTQTTPHSLPIHPIWSYWRLAICYINQQDWLRADENFKKVSPEISFSIQDFRFYRDYAFVNRQLGHYGAANELYKRASDLIDGDAGLPKVERTQEKSFCLNAIGETSVELEKYDESWQYFFDAKQVWPKNAEASFNLAALFAMKDDTAKVREHLLQGLSLLSLLDSVHLRFLRNYVTNNELIKGHPECYKELLNLFEDKGVISSDYRDILSGSVDEELSRLNKVSLKGKVINGQIDDVLRSLYELPNKSNDFINQVIWISSERERYKKMRLIVNENSEEMNTLNARIISTTLILIDEGFKTKQ